MITENMERETTERRNFTLFKYYLNIIKKHGNYAKYIPKEQLYEEAGKPFFIGKRSVYMIIKKMLQEKEISWTEVEISEDLKDVLKAYHG